MADVQGALPASKTFDLVGPAKCVTALEADPSGSRLAAGGNDYMCHLYDFGGLRADGKSFRSFEVAEGHPVVAVSWSPTGELFLVVTSYSQPKVYNRDGKEVGEFPKGDMYIRDLKNTKGHVTNCTGGCWHPTDKTTVLTCSEDGTLRVWDANEVCQKTVIKPQLVKPGRVSVTGCSYSADGRLIAAGLADGTVQLWDARGKFGQSAAIGLVPVPKAQMVAKQAWTYASAPGQIVRSAHEAGTDITCLRFSVSAQNMLTRGGDGTLKLWDLRKFKSPLCTADGLPCNYISTQCCYSPDETYVLTGTSAEAKDSSGSLVVLDAASLEKRAEVAVDGSAVAVQWHARINQIFLGCGGRTTGCVRTLYDPKLSTKGAVVAASRAPRTTTTDFMQLGAPQIFNPNALPMYRDESVYGRPANKRKRAEMEEAERRRRKQPEMGGMPKGVSVGAGGQLGASSSSLLTMHVLKSQGKEFGRENSESVREKLLSHENKVDEFSQFTAAYQKTQPQKMFAEDQDEEDDDR